VAIGLARRSEVPAILELSNWAALQTTANFATEAEPLEAWQASYDQTAPTYPWLVARAGDEVVGFAKASPHRSRAAYAWTAEASVYVDPTHHQRGIGRALYDRLIATLRAQGYVSLLAGIVDGHAASERLHAAVGFVRCGRFARVGWKRGAWHDVGYWELALQPNDAPPRPIDAVAAAWPGDTLAAATSRK